MASSSQVETSGSARKLKRLAFAIVAFVLIYTAGWFYGAAQLKDLLLGRMVEAEAGAFSVSCPGLETRGFPFRIGVFCDSVGMDDRSSGASASFGALRSAAQVYRPGHAIIELDGPAEFRVSPYLSVTADWSLLHASAVAWLDGLQRGSLSYDGLNGRLNAPARGVSAGFAARHGEAHVRQNGEALDVALSADGLSLSMVQALLPAFDIAADITFADAARWISKEGPPENPLRGSRGELRRLSIDIGNGRTAALSGPFSINDEGALSGQFDLDMRGIDVWRDAIISAFPDTARTVRNIAATVKALSGNGQDAVVKLNVNDGTVYLGMIPIAFLEPF
ncbi:MAG: DUF2125 domain-containing protein [Shinella sp.]|nr:DUF2125 domain-containing protein [Shinella sp.]